MNPIDPAMTGQNGGGAGCSPAWARRSRAIAGIFIFLLVFADCLWWAKKIPYNNAPDEYEHLHLQTFVAENLRLPRFGEEDFVIHLLDSSTKQATYPKIDPASGNMLFPKDAVIFANHSYLVQSPYLFTPELAHLAAGVYSRLLGGITILKARSFSAICISLCSLFLYWAGLLIWPGKPLRAIACGLGFGLWPQITFIGAYVNDDAFALLAASSVLLFCAWTEKRGFDDKAGFVFAVCVAAILLSKYYSFAFFPLLALWLLYRVRLEGGKIIRHAALGGAMGLVLGGWWYVLNAIKYNGDFLGRATLDRHFSEFFAALPPGLQGRCFGPHVFTYDRFGIPFSKFLFKDWFLASFKSFYGYFCWLSCPLPAALYWIAALVFLAACTALTATFLKRKDKARLLLSAVFLFSFPNLILLVALSLYNSFYVDFQPQGRYLLSSLPALILLVVRGLDSLPGRAGRWAIALLPVFLFAQSVAIRFLYLH